MLPVLFELLPSTLVIGAPLAIAKFNNTIPVLFLTTSLPVPSFLLRYKRRLPVEYGFHVLFPSSPSLFVYFAGQKYSSSSSSSNTAAARASVSLSSSLLFVCVSSSFWEVGVGVAADAAGIGAGDGEPKLNPVNFVGSAVGAGAGFLNEKVGVEDDVVASDSEVLGAGDNAKFEPKVVGCTGLVS